MTPALWVELLKALNNFGFEAAIAILDGIKNAKTPEEAAAALKKSYQVSWQDFKRTESPVPPTPTPPV